MESSVTEGEIGNTRAYIKGSVADMQSLLVDVENNVAKDERCFQSKDAFRVLRIIDSRTGVILGRFAIECMALSMMFIFKRE